MEFHKRTPLVSPPPILSAFAFALVLFASTGASAKEYYVATTGGDTNTGTLDAPFATLQKAVGVATAGDTVYIRGGTYSITTPASSSGGVLFNKSGTSDSNRIRYWAYPGEVPVFDFSNLQISTSGYTMGFYVTGSWLHFKGLELCNVPMNQYSNNALSVDGGSNDIFEQLNMHHNSGNGIFIGKGNGGHLVLNCDAHDNFDATSNQGEGQNADGFGVHYQTSGATTIVRGCRAWWNSDDGYDLINQEVPVTVENSWAMGNGYAKYGTYNPADGNGNGFKMGSSKTGVRHLVQYNVAWKNKASGFYANHSSGGNTWYNNTSYNNGTQYNMLASSPNDSSTTITLTGDRVHIMRNNIGFPNKNTNMTGVDTAFNTWDLSLTPASKDFLSVSDPSVSGTGASIETSGALGPRQADGSLPNVDFLKLVAGSQMIDKGTDVGLPFVGAAPDLGAYEFGASTAAIDGGTGPGGSTGSGGTAGRGGAAGAGGAVGSGGSPGAGGRTGANTGVGGAIGKGGAVGTGGTPGSGGGLGSGGKLGAGGAVVLGGSSGTGGVTDTGASAGHSTVPSPTTNRGCSCNVGSAADARMSALIVLTLLAFAARRRRFR
jgi:MYXO-CTERM domain-containing protein